MTEKSMTSSQNLGISANSLVGAFQKLHRAFLSAINISDTIGSAD